MCLAGDRKSPQIDEEVLFFQLFLLCKPSGRDAGQHPLLTRSTLLQLIPRKNFRLISTHMTREEEDSSSLDSIRTWATSKAKAITTLQESMYLVIIV